MANTLTLFSKNGGYPQYTPIEPETTKIADTEFKFDLPKSYTENTVYVEPVSPAALRITPVATAQTIPTTTAAEPARTTLPSSTASLSTTKRTTSTSTVPTDKVETYLKRAQIATGIQSAAQIGQGIATLANANAGVDAVERIAQMRETNLAQNEALMYENMRDTIAQLDAVTAAKNVDLTSSAVVGMKERGMTDLGKDVRTRQLAVKFQNAVDKYNAAQQKEAQVTQGILQVAQGVMTAATLFI